MRLHLSSCIFRRALLTAGSLAAALLLFHWAYPRYCYPLLGAVDEATLGAVLATRVDELVEQGVIKAPGGNTASVGVCFEASGHFRSGKPFFAAEPFSVFRAISGAWSLEGWLLDRYLTPAMLAQQVASEAPFGLNFDPEVVFAVCRHKLRKHMEVHPRFLEEKERRQYEAIADGLRFFGSCSEMQGSVFGFPIIRVVAVSPLVASRFSLNRGVAKASAFFLAEELTIPGVTAERHVFYYIANPLIIRCRKELGRGSWRWGIEVPEEYWVSSWPFRQFATLLQKTRCCWLHVDTGYRFLGFSQRL